MPSHDEIYKDLSFSYEDMVSRQPDLTEYIKEIRSYKGLDVLDLGAGSGRLSSFIALEANSLVCTDISESMLELLDKKLITNSLSRNWTTVVADHRKLPIDDASIDFIVSGWSISYLTNTGNIDWKENLELIVSELMRVLKPAGTPNPPKFLTEYYSLLESKYGFSHRWIRTDYQFANTTEAKENMEFFFGSDISRKIDENQWSTVPECAGIWWKHV
ncbi:class I SAM-dependent methyltransferase [Paenibacillus sp. N3/727]|uniref:class I SAM-dependent methyltransferase n=1 Tax=Paenibacillus sp. N3/727 TaxID=2925845 RepID=UPI001F532301|nr:class I SAM-dependent methyltransferase [Paenibacillus sp. N3/727]UNK20297.1 class I SAM-dependent methyltransferase [Paenibacillus sp. N3/727]